MANNDPDPNDAAAPSDAGDASSSTTANSSAPRRSASETRKTPATSGVAAAHPPLRKQLSGNLVQTPSAGSSPLTSRNTSPIRKESRPQPVTTPIATQPSAAAIQRALSAANVPALPGGANGEAGRAPRAGKSSSTSGDNTPQWPVSPRLKSPPPSGPNSRRGSSSTLKRVEVANPPSISVQSATPQNNTPPPTSRQASEESTKPAQLQTPAKGPSRGASGKSTLATVQENTTDDVKEPSPAAIKAAADLKPLTKLSEGDKQPASKSDATEGDKQHAESGSESAGKAESKKQQSSQAPKSKAATIKSFAPLASVKSRQGEGKQGMTVETETVSSIPQSAIGTGERAASARNENGGSVRLKPSIETIRPKKERKKPTQKARSINQGTGTFFNARSPLLTSQEQFGHTNNDAGDGSSSSSSTARATSSGAASPRTVRRSPRAQPQYHTLSFRRPSQYIRNLSDRYLRKASSKADIFEARVASAVEDANSSDSDETFVYESNPPEPTRHRHHSRTPSVASAHSTADTQRSGIRNFGDVLDERRVAGKRSMKFSNNSYNDPDTPEGKDGSVRSHTPRHFGRFGRGGNHASMFDQDSPFTQASKLRTGHYNGGRGSRPNSPRSPQQGSGQGTPRSATGGLFGRNKEPTYDFDAEGADDERTPLVGTVRTPRRYARRVASSNGGASIDEYYGVRRQSRCKKVGGCVLAMCVFAVVLLAAAGFFIMSFQPMYDVRIKNIQNVLASEEELMLDLLVGAVNPNALSITVTEMDVNIFAKSRHVGNGEFWRRHGTQSLTASETLPRNQKSRRRNIATGSTEIANPRTHEDLSHHWHAPSGGVDDGTDPPSDDDLYKDAQTMLLGRKFHLDTTLMFEGTPFKRHAHFSIGELRLEKPGNRTEAGGSERWAQVLQYPFELIVRGVIRYDLPVSFKKRSESAAISASVVVHPEEGVDGRGAMRVEPVDLEERWEWVEWPVDGEEEEVGDAVEAG